MARYSETQEFLVENNKVIFLNPTKVQKEIVANKYNYYRAITMGEGIIPEAHRQKYLIYQLYLTFLLTNSPMLFNYAQYENTTVFEIFKKNFENIVFLEINEDKQPAILSKQNNKDKKILTIYYSSTTKAILMKIIEIRTALFLAEYVEEKYKKSLSFEQILNIDRGYEEIIDTAKYEEQTIIEFLDATKNFKTNIFQQINKNDIAPMETAYKTAFTDLKKQELTLDLLLNEIPEFVNCSQIIKIRIANNDFLCNSKKYANFKNTEPIEQIFSIENEKKLKEIERKQEKYQMDAAALTIQLQQLQETYYRSIQEAQKLIETRNTIGTKFKERFEIVLNDPRIHHYKVSNETLLIFTEPIIITIDSNKINTYPKWMSEYIKKGYNFGIGRHLIAINLVNTKRPDFYPIDQYSNHHIENSDYRPGRINSMYCLGTHASEMDLAVDGKNFPKIINLSLSVISSVTAGDFVGTETMQENNMYIIANNGTCFFHNEPDNKLLLEQVLQISTNKIFKTEELEKEYYEYSSGIL